MRESALAVALAALAGCGAPAASPPCTGEPFLKFRAAAEKAAKVEPLLPLLAAATRKLYMDGVDDGMLDLLKQASDKKDAQVQQAAVQDGRCVVNLSAFDAAGKARKGTYMFELEDGQWKLLSFGWPE